MNYKIYKIGNYLRIQNIESGEIYNGLLKEVFVDKNNLNNNLYKIQNVKDWSERTALNLNQIKKQDGSDYTLSEWETFYSENTGNFNSGGSSSLPTDVENALLGANSPSSTNVFTTMADVGISKLYNALGTQTDGGITPNAVNTALAYIQEQITPNLDYFIEKEGDDISYSKIGQTSLALNVAINLDNITSESIHKYLNKIKLYGGRKYKLTGKLRVNFANSTSFARFCFYDETNSVYIDKNYTQKGFGNSSLNLPMSSTINNTSSELTTAVVFPTTNIFVSLKLIEVSGTISEIDSNRIYSSVIVEEVGTDDVKILVNLNTELPEHPQGSVYTLDYPNNIFVSMTDRVVKVNKTTGLIDATYLHASHLGDVCYFNGKLYVAYTPIASFNSANPTSSIIELNPIDMTLIRDVPNIGINAFGGIGTDGTKMYIGYGGSALTTGKIQEVNTTTLLLTGSVTEIPAVDNEFGNGIQTLNYFNSKWYIGTHLKGISTDPASFNGGGLITTNNSFVVDTIYKKNSGDWADGYGNGFIEYNSNIYYCESKKIEAPYTSRFVLLEV